MEKHVTVVGVIHIGFSVLGLLAALIIFVSTVGSGIISGDEEALAILTTVGVSVALVLILLSVPGIVGGIGLLRYRPWARYLILILAVLDLFNIPIGTAAGVYTIWVLVQDETAQLFTSGPGV